MELMARMMLLMMIAMIMIGASCRTPRRRIQNQEPHTKHHFANFLGEKIMQLVVKTNKDIGRAERMKLVEIVVMSF